MSAFYDRMRATADRLVTRFDQGATAVVTAVSYRDEAEIVAGVISGVGVGYANYPPLMAGSATGWLTYAYAIYSDGDGDYIQILHPGNVTSILDAPLIVNGIEYPIILGPIYGGGSTVAVYSGPSFSDGVSYKISIASDPLKPPVVNKVETPIPAVVRGVTAAMVAADPNLLSTDLQVIMGPQGESVIGASSLSVNGQDRRVISIERIPASGTVCAVRAVVR